MIFLTLSTSLAAAIIYDKRETKRAQKKWCKLVEHLAEDPITDSKVMPRKLRIFLEAPPGDGLRVAQDHFKEYVKPILVASGVDWEFVQGRREGDIRAAVAERIRKQRQGGSSDEDDPIEKSRRAAGITEFDGVKGDIVVGRNTWKEYVRGIHEGWLGPVEAPAPVQKSDPTAESGDTTKMLAETTMDEKSSESEVSKPETPTEQKEKPGTRPLPTPPYISPSQYSSASLPATIPSEFDPTYPVPFPHILGFFNSHVRLYRFLTRRRLADAIGRDTAAIILSTYRPFESITAETSFISDDQSPVPPSFPSENDQVVVEEESELSEAIREEEKEWDKSVFNPKPPAKSDSDTPEPGVKSEKTWVSPIATDPRITARMRKAELSDVDEAKAKEIVVKEEEIEGVVKGSLRWAWRWGMGTLEKGVSEDRAVDSEEMERRNKLLAESADQ